MKKIYILGIFLLLLLTGCGQNRTASETLQINEEVPPNVTNIPLSDADRNYYSSQRQETGQKDGEKLVRWINVTWENEIRYLYEYQDGNKFRFELANLQPDNTWEISTPKWEQALLKKAKAPLDSLEICSDGSYLAMIQPEDDLPVFYHILLDGTVTEHHLPDGILEWKKDSHEMANGMLLTEKDEIALSTYTIPPEEYRDVESDGTNHQEPAHLIVYNPYTKKLVSKRNYIGLAQDLFIKGDHVFSTYGNSIDVYLLKGGDIQSIYTTDELQKKSAGQSVCTYPGGNYAYWYTNLGIYRLDVSLVANAENTVEKLIPSKYYQPPEKNFSIFTMSCIEDGKTASIYIKGSTYEEEEVDDENKIFHFSDPVLTKYVYEE